PRIVTRQPGQHTADRGQPDQTQKDRAGSYRRTRWDAHRSKLPDQQPTFDVAVERRPPGRVSGPDAVAYHGYTGAAELDRAAGDPAPRAPAFECGPQPGRVQRRLDTRRRDTAVEQRDIVDDGLAVQQPLIAGRQPLRAADDHRPGLVADQRHPPGRPPPS